MDIFSSVPMTSCLFFLGTPKLVILGAELDVDMHVNYSFLKFS